MKPCVQRRRRYPKYGNDDDYVDSIAKKLADYFYHDVTAYKDIYGHHFVTAFMGISNYLPTGKVLGATPDGRRAKDPINEGVSPYTGTDTSTCLAALRSSAKLNHDIHSGGTLLNLRLNHDLVATKRGRANLGAMLQSYFALGCIPCTVQHHFQRGAEGCTGASRKLQRPACACGRLQYAVCQSVEIHAGFHHGKKRT